MTEDNNEYFGVVQFDFTSAVTARYFKLYFLQLDYIRGLHNIYEDINLPEAYNGSTLLVETIATVPAVIQHLTIAGTLANSYTTAAICSSALCFGNSPVRSRICSGY